MAQLVQPRDIEILRALARLHFLRAADINAAFFRSPKCGWRRIAELVGRDLIKPKPSKSLRGSTHYRITSRGLGVLLDEFPDELVDGLDERLSHVALPDPEHHEALVRLYLQLIAEDEPDDGSAEALRLWMVDVRHRASRITWHGDGDVLLDYHVGFANERLVPDATIACPEKRLRLFVELDRSNKGLSRIRENIERYRRFLLGPYAEQFTDGFTPCLVYVVRSELRRANVRETARSILGHAVVHESLVAHLDAVSWFAATLFDEERPVAGGDAPASGLSTCPRDAVAAQFLASTAAFIKRHGSFFEELRFSDDEVVRRWRNDLQAFSDTFASLNHAG